MATALHETPERRQAIWPHLVMPLVVLVVFYALQHLQGEALGASAQTKTTPAHAAADGDSPGP